MGKLSRALRASYLVTEQKKSLEDVFTEEPVPLTEFIQGRRYLANPPLSEVQYDAVLHAERVYYPDLYPLMGAQMDPYWAAPVRSVNFVDLLWGKGSGKDHVARVISLRVAYLLVCLRSPQVYYGLPDQDFIHLLNVASTAPQANRAFFQPMTSAVSRGWFADHAEPTQGAISYDKHVTAISGHSEAETQEGLNLLLGVADEIDAFPSAARARTMGGKEPLNTVEGVLNMLRSSATTRFPGRTPDEAPVFKNVRISYPRYVGSPIERLVADGKRDIERMGAKSRRYVSGPLATWQVNPRVHGKEAFADDYREDPVMARAKYECAPALAVSPYFRNGIAVDAAFGAHQQGLSIVDYTWSANAWAPEYEYAEHLVPLSGANYAMHADLAITGDAAGVAMSHVARWEQVERMQEGERGELTSFVELRPVVVVDFVASWTADVSTEPGREIQVRWARQLAFELVRRGFNVQRFSFDGFQSVDSIQILEAHGIESERVSTDRTDELWKNLRDLLYEGRVHIGQCPDLLRELLSLDRLPNGKVDHPPAGSKDLADALAGSVHGAVLLGGEESGERSYWDNGAIEVGTGFEPPEGLAWGPGVLDDWQGPKSGYGGSHGGVDLRGF